MKFRKKPVVIDAELFDGSFESANRISVLYGRHNVSPALTNGNFNKKLVCHTLEGDIFAQAGDYIIKGIKGEVYPCKPDIFNATYSADEDESQYLYENDMFYRCAC